MPLEPAEPSAMRVSHEDRDQVAEALRVAAGDGRLTPEELDERLEAALAARTFGDLAPLLADIPGVGSGTLVTLNQALAAAPAQPKEVMRITRHGGGVKYEGVWLVPKRLELELRGGSVLLDFTRATVAGALTEVNVALRGGSLRIIVPPGYSVQANEVELHGGSVRDRSGRGILPDSPVVHHIVVTGIIKGGSVIIRPPRRERRSRRAVRLRRGQGE